ncbi:hypothetical protein ACFVUY_40080 [Kitasatospora sp. NPDC058063]|uniref:hypothetical protein n=1 Tax=unclassified Kitasatospora TaxID=2633591 RepID=UPI0036D97244
MPPEPAEPDTEARDRLTPQEAATDGPTPPPSTTGGTIRGSASAQPGAALRQPPAQPPYSVFGDPGYEIVESRQVGESTYVRAYRRGTEEESLWVHRREESEELMTSGGAFRPHDAYRTMTGPNAPTSLYEQLVKEGDLWDVQVRDNERWERERERAEAETALHGLDAGPDDGMAAEDDEGAAAKSPSSDDGWLSDALALTADMPPEQAALLRERLGVLTAAPPDIRHEPAPDDAAHAGLPPEQALAELTSAIETVRARAEWWLALPQWAQVQSVQAAAVGAWAAVKEAVGQQTVLADGEYRATRLLRGICAAACRAVSRHAADLAHDLTTRGYGGTPAWTALRALSRRAGTLAARVLGRPVDRATARRLAALDAEVVAVAKAERADRRAVLADGADRVAAAFAAWAGTPMGRRLARSAHPRVAALRRAWQGIPRPGIEPVSVARAYARLARAARSLADAARAARRFRSADVAVLDAVTRAADEHTRRVAPAAGLTPPPPAVRHAPYATRQGASGGSMLVADALSAWTATEMGGHLHGSRHPRVAALRASWRSLPPVDLPGGPAVAARAFHHVAHRARALAEAARAGGRFRPGDLAALDALALAAAVHAGRLAATAGITLPSRAGTPTPPAHRAAALRLAEPLQQGTSPSARPSAPSWS